MSFLYNFSTYHTALFFDPVRLVSLLLVDDLFSRVLCFGLIQLSKHATFLSYSCISINLPTGGHTDVFAYIFTIILARQRRLRETLYHLQPSKQCSPLLLNLASHFESSFPGIVGYFLVYELLCLGPDIYTRLPNYPPYLINPIVVAVRSLLGASSCYWVPTHTDRSLIRIATSPLIQPGQPRNL